MLADQFGPVFRDSAPRPSRLAHSVEDEPEAFRLVLRAAVLDVLHHLRVDADCHFLSGRVPEPAWRYAVAIVAISQPTVDLFGDRRVAADHDEHGRHRVFLLLLGLLLPLRKPLVPFLSEQIDRCRGIVHHDLGRDVGAEAIFLGFRLHPPPDVEVGGFLRPRYISGG